MAKSEPRQSHLVLNGDTFRRLVEEGTRCVEQYVEAINALNVFPVPDGDTGTNMALTLRTALSSPDVPQQGAGTVAEVSHGIARGALLGARGNSGVILSQFLKGFAAGLGDCVECDGPAMKNALRAGADAAYQAVGAPVEGTMLTVMRAAAHAVDSSDLSLPAMWAVAYRAAEDALEHTPEQLPVLKEAGVVDAGGQGVVAFMAGAQAFLTAREMPPLQIAVPVGGVREARAIAVSHQFLQHTQEAQYGYCTAFVVRGASLNIEELRDHVNAIATSTVVVGDEIIARVHAHVADPGPLLSMGAGLGSLEQIKIENMDTMHQEFMERHGYVPQKVPVGVVAVAMGAGLEQVFRELGATVIVHGDQTMNPSTGELLEAVKLAEAAHVLLLPNNPNIFMAAEQAKPQADCACTIVPAKTIPQGIAALLAFNPDLDAAANVEVMTNALKGVRSGEVTTAVRDSTVGGISIRRGQAMALLDGQLMTASDTSNGALMGLLEHAEVLEGTLVTLYWGGDADQAAADSAAEEARRRWPHVEIQVVSGGQPHYGYLVSIE